MLEGLRAIYGPFKPEVSRNNKGQTTLVWHFNGVRANHEMAHWKLSYNITEDSYLATNIPLKTGYIGKLRSNPVMVLPENRGMFHGGEAPRVKVGKVTDLLKEHLGREAATAIARFKITGEI